MKILTSWDDGHELDVKVMKLLRKYNLPGIFFIPIISWGFENLDQYKDFEVGGHTYSHPPDLKKLNRGARVDEIWCAKRTLEDKFTKPIEWFCYPKGKYNKIVIADVKRYGFKYARTTNIGHDGSDYEKLGYHCYQRKEYEGMDWLKYIKEAFIVLKNLGKAEEFHIWGHSHEINKYNEWDKLEELFKYIKNNK